MSEQQMANYTLAIQADSGYESTTEGRCTAEQYGQAIAALHGTSPPAQQEQGELRRLNEANQAMLEAAEDAVARIKSQLLLLRCDDEFIAHETQKLRVAIAIAKGEKT